jgi:MFS family permease
MNQVTDIQPQVRSGDSERALYPPARQANFMLLVLYICYVCSFVDRQIISILIGPIKDTFAISDFQFSLIQGLGFAIFYSVAGFPLGRIADTHNRRNLILVALMVWSVMTCMGGLASTVTILFIARIGVAVGEAGLSPAAYSMLSDSYEPKYLGFALSFYKMAVPVGVGLSMLGGGFLYDFFLAQDGLDVPLIGHLLPWQLTLFSVGALGFSAALLVLLIKEPRRLTSAVDGEEFRSAVPSLGEVFSFLYRHRQAYGLLLLACSLMAIVNYGISSWFVEFLTRQFAMSKSDAGASFGLIFLISGTLGILAGPWLARFLDTRGYRDSYVRANLIALIIAVFPATAAPLMQTPFLSLSLIAVAICFNSTYIGVLAAAFQLITPNRMRGQITAIYLFCATILGLALGSSVVAAITDFAFADEGALNFSLAVMSGIFIPIAAVILFLSLAPYRRMIEQRNVQTN